LKWMQVQISAKQRGEVRRPGERQSYRRVPPEQQRAIVFFCKIGA
jgi:hypothetical protein